jgi:glycosyltransferase involved in cell wall biosynthesis
MASPSALVLLTNTFPYGNAEPFLETEIGYLARGFERVTVVPSRADGTPRPLPPGVVVDTSLASTRRPGLARAGVALGGTLTSALFYRELSTRPWLLPRGKALARMVVFLDHATRVRRWLLAALHRGRFEAERTLFYTYWLVPQALGVALARARHPGLRLVSRAHRHDLYEYDNDPPYLPFQQATLGGIDRVFAVSRHGLDYVAEHYASSRAACEVSRLGVGDPGFDTAPSSDGVFRVVSCSFIIPVKRLDRLVDALALLGLRLAGAAVEWHHIGDGPGRAELEARARARLPSAVRPVFHGHLTNRDVVAFYRRQPLDVFVNVSESEGLPVAVMEAQSCGIPVIAPAVGGMPEIVNDENGSLLDAEPSPAAIAQALARMAGDRPGTRAKSEASKGTWRSLYCAETNYAAFVERLRGAWP